MDVTATTRVSASPQRVAAFMFDPRHDPEWIGGAKSVEHPSSEPTRIGATVTRHGGFLGRKFSWTTKVVEYEANRWLRMEFVAGPMVGGEVTYRIEADEGGSIVSIRNTGKGPQLVGWLVKRSVTKDLERLGRLVEQA